MFLPLALSWSVVGRAADVPAAQTNPRYTGVPFISVWRAEDYGAHPENSSVVQHPGTRFVYFGNRNGLLEFDGARWRTIPTPGGVRSLCLDPRGRIWGCTATEVFRLDADALGAWHAKSMRARLPPAWQPDSALTQGVATGEGVCFRDEKQMIHFGMDDEPAQIWRLSDGPAVILRIWAIDGQPYATVGAPVNTILRRRGGTFERTVLTRSVLASRADPGGGWQLLTLAAIQRWRGDELTTVQPLPAGEVADHAAFLADGRGLFGTRRSGLVVYDHEGRLLQKIDRAQGLPSNSVAGVATDLEGGVWLALRDGIARVQLDSPYARHGPVHGLEGNVTALARHGEDLFAGTTEGLVRRAPDGRFRVMPGPIGASRDLVADGPWLFNLSPQLYRVQVTGEYLAQVLENRNYFGLVPLAGWPGWYAHGSNEGLRWARFAGERWTSEGPLKAWRGAASVLLESPAGIVWSANRSAGAARVDFRDGLRPDAPVQHFHAAEGMPGAPAAMFLFGGEIVALAARKLVRFDQSAGRFVPENRIAGLDRFPIDRIHPSADGTVWLQGGLEAGREVRRVVPAGPDAADKIGGTARWRAETLPGESLRHLSPTALFHDSATRTLWIGGYGALVSRDLDWRPVHAAAPPAAVVRRIETASGQLLAADAVLAAGGPLAEFRPDQDALRVVFAAPAFSPDHAGAVHTEYRTRLDGIEREWSGWSRHAERDFTHLPARSFTFRVQARDGAGRIGPEAALAFAIAPAWWATPWAWAGYGALALLGVAGVVRLRTHALHARAARLEATIAERTLELARSAAHLSEANVRLAASNAELARLHRLELDGKIAAQLAEEKARLEVLRYQLNPHFLYNSLNSIYGLLFENARDAGEMVLRLSEFCRATLTGTKDELPTLGAEIGALRTYLDVEQVRWSDKLRTEIDVAPEAEAVRLPPFLLLPLVENAIKYGSRTSPEVLQLRIAAVRENGSVRIEIANTGEWLAPDRARRDSTGIGLDNLRQRLHRYYPDAHEFAMEAKDGWVTARLKLAEHVAVKAPPDRGPDAGRPPG